MAPKKAGRAVQLPKGTVVPDGTKRSFALGTVLGRGGFGTVYSGKRSDDGATEYAVKVEPKDNGPLFTENAMYMRSLKADMLDKFRKEHKLKHLALPAFISCGTFTYGDVELRFLVMLRYGCNVDSVREACADHRLPPRVALTLAKTCLNAIHYLHSNNIVLADLKAENIMLTVSTRKATDTVHACDDIIHERVMLTDFGLCHRLTGAVVYKELKKRAGDGTLCYNTIDAHKGAECTYRGDVEILVYCLCEWLAGPLPWKAAGTNDTVLSDKVKLIADGIGGVRRLLAAAALGEHVVASVHRLLQYARTLDYAELPDYTLLIPIVDAALKDVGGVGSSKRVKLLSSSRVLNESNASSEVIDTPPPKVRKPAVKQATKSADKPTRSTLKVTNSSVQTSPHLWK